MRGEGGLPEADRVDNAPHPRETMGFVGVVVRQATLTCGTCQLCGTGNTCQPAAPLAHCP